MTLEDVTHLSKIHVIKLIMNIGIKLGEYDVINSGTVIALEGVPLVFSIADLMISFVFVTKQEDDTQMSIQKKVISSREAVIEFINFDSQLGSGLVSPFVVGTFQNREFSFLVRFSQLNKGGKLVNYTWLVRDYPRMSENTEVSTTESESK